MLRVGIGLFAGLISFGLSLLTIAAAWIFYRPLVGIPLLVLASAALVGIFMMGQKKKAARHAASGAPAAATTV